MKIALNYDPQSGSVSDDAGAVICSWSGLTDHEIDSLKPVPSKTLVELKEAGFETEDITS